MNLRVLAFALAGAVPVLGIVILWHSRPPATTAPTVLSFRVGETFEEVVKNSTYPILQHSNPPWDDPMHLQSGETFVTEPAVILQFNDPRHGFTLPPTKFALVGYDHNKVTTVSTSPMLDAVPFEEAVAVLENLQNQFKAGGWEPWKGDGSTWFDLSVEGKKRLYKRMFNGGYAQSAELRIPAKYAMTFRLKCAEGCWSRDPPYKFLVDVGVGHDVHEWWDKTDPKDRRPVTRNMPD